MLKREALPEGIAILAASGWGDSEMASMSFRDYRGMIEDSPVSTRMNSSERR